MNKYTLSLLIWLLLIITPSVFAQHSTESIGKQYLPVDTDGDGVLDEVDECYKTEPGARVDERGCYITIKDKQEITLNIQFAVDSSQVNADYFSEIGKVARFMMQYPLTRVIIEGHTDSDGADDYNQALSQRRAAAVARLLIDKYNIPAIRVTAIGYGEQRPLVANTTGANKYRNRRVVAVISALVEKRG